MFYCLSTNHNPEFGCVIHTDVTHFALALHLNCTALSQSESSTFFMYIISNKKTILPGWLFLLHCWVSPYIRYSLKGGADLRSQLKSILKIVFPGSRRLGNPHRGQSSNLVTYFSLFEFRSLLIQRKTNWCKIKDRPIDIKNGNLQVS